MKRKVIIGVIFLMLTTPVLAQQTYPFYNDFENEQVGSQPNEWNGGTVEDISLNEFHSIEVPPSSVSGEDVVWVNGPEIGNSAGEFQALIQVNSNSNLQLRNDTSGDSVGVDFLATQPQDITLSVDVNGVENEDVFDPSIPVDSTWWNVHLYMNDTKTTLEVYNAEDSNPTVTTLQVNTPDTFTGGKITAGTASTGSSYIDWIGATGTETLLNGTVTDVDNNALSNVMITVNQSGSVFNTANTDENGSYLVGVDNGTYNVTAQKPGYVNKTIEVNVSGVTTQNFTLINKSDAFSFDVNNWMEHGTTQSYTAEYTNLTGTHDVSDSTTVTSNNTSIVTVNNAANQLVATSDESVADITYVEATYKNITVRENITVANRTLDNIGIMPSSQWHTTVLGFGESQAQWGIGSEIQWILVAIFTGAGAAWIAKNEWIGIGIIDAALLLFWVLGRVGLGIMLVAVFYSLMAGYQLQQTPSRSDTDVGSRIPDQFTREP